MYTPKMNDVIQLAKQYNLIPVSRSLLADMETPIRIFQHFYEEKQAFLLESVEGGLKWARYSFIGTNPFMTVTAKNGVTTVDKNGEIHHFKDSPVNVLRTYMRDYSSPALPDLPRFSGGAVGFFGYDLLRYYEQLPAHQVDDLQMDDLHIMFCDQVIVFDHFKQQVIVIANMHVPSGATDEQIVQAYELACSKIEDRIEQFRKPSPSYTLTHNPMPEDVDLGTLNSNVTKEQFMANVEAAKQYIHSGEISQVVLSQRFEMEAKVSPLQVYRILRTMNPSPYMYCLKMGEDVIVGSSPELLVRVEDGRAETRPIAGTRPRGATPEEDLQMEQELLGDEKEIAEHKMLVDLGKADLSRVSHPESVTCDSYMHIERYSHVMHIVSNVSGKLRKDKDFFDAFISCLPAGTVSGAPRLRAMEIIVELEKEARGPYAGSIGYLGFSGNMDSCITIRTIVFKNGKAYVQAGAGIVADSVPEREFEETVNKAKALLKSIRMAENVFAVNQTERQAETNHDYY